MREILFVAGEASGDLHAAGVAHELRTLRPDLALAGIGGSAMEAEGVTLVEHAEKLAVMGFVEVLKHVPKHWALLRELKQRLRSGRVALLVLIDYPGFNMKLARATQLQARAVHQQVHGFAVAAPPRPRHLQRLGPAA